ALPGLSGISTRDYRAAWRGADPGRGNDRLSLELWGRAAALQDQARLNHSGQDHRRRIAGGRLRWSRRTDGHDRPTRPRVPGRNALWKPTSDGSRNRYIARAENAPGNLS